MANLATVLKQEATAVQLINRIVDACAETKGKDIKVLDVSQMLGLADYFVIVSGRSDRQVQGISNKIIQALEEIGAAPLHVEGIEQSHWVLLDIGDVVVHVFYEPMREHYDLESLWHKAPKISLTTLEPLRQSA